MSSCRPIMGVTRGAARNPRAEAACGEYNAAMAEAARVVHADLVVLVARWHYPGIDVLPAPGERPAPGVSLFRHGLEQTLARAHPPGRVCVVYDVPQLEYPAPESLAIARMRGIDTDFLRPTRAAAQLEQAAEETEFEALRARGAIISADPKRALCRDRLCRIEADGRPLYADTGHLTVEGALFVKEEIDHCFRSVDAGRPAP